MKWWSIFISLVGVLVWSDRAWAQDPAAAEALFREGRALVAQGKTEAACLKFKASQALEASPGTLLNLAACHRSLGKSATAWAEFVAAARLARAQRKDRQEAEATLRIAELEPTLSYLTLQVADPVPGLEIRRDGTLLEPSVYGTRVPIDPGEHRFEARAPGYEPLSFAIQIGQAKSDEVLSVPRLRRSGESASAVSPRPRRSAPTSRAPATATGTAPAPPRANRSTRTLPWVVGGAGVAFLAAGSVSGVLALRSNSAAAARCPDAARCNDPEARALADRRDAQALIGNIGVGVGVLGLGVAAVLLITSKSDGPTEAHGLLPALSRDSAGLSFSEYF